jgi:Tol biopolymer transport system component
VLPGKGNNSAPVWLPDGRILFNSDRGGIWRIYTMAADGSDVRSLSAGSRAETHAGIALGGKLMLVRRGPRSWAIRDLVSGATKPLSFTSFPGVGGEIWPALAPDASRIAFLFKGGSGASRAVHAAAVTEEASRYAVGTATKTAVGCFVSWAPDSSGFLLSIIKAGVDGCDLYFAREAPGGLWNKTRVTTAVSWDYFGAYSPDGSRLIWAASPAYNHELDSPTYEIYARSADGGTPVRLTKDGYADNAPSWSGPLP